MGLTNFVFAICVDRSTNSTQFEQFGLHPLLCRTNVRSRECSQTPRPKVIFRWWKVKTNAIWLIEIIVERMACCVMAYNACFVWPLLCSSIASCHPIVPSSGWLQDLCANGFQCNVHDVTYGNWRNESKGDSLNAARPSARTGWWWAHSSKSACPHSSTRRCGFPRGKVRRCSRPFGWDWICCCNEQKDLIAANGANFDGFHIQLQLKWRFMIGRPLGQWLCLESDKAAWLN